MSKKTKKLWQIVMLLSVNVALLIIVCAANAEAICLGGSGERVAEIQRELKKLGLFSGEISGEFDFKTRRAVKNFQQINSIKSNGEANFETLSLMGLNSKNRCFCAETELLARYLQNHGGAEYYDMLSTGIEAVRDKGSLTLSRYIMLSDPEFFGNISSDEPSPQAYSAAIHAIEKACDKTRRPKSKIKENGDFS